MSKIKQIRPSAVSGMFYPGDPDTLEDQISGFIHEKPNKTTGLPKAIIVPHAGTVYSGSIAAAAYRTLLQYRNLIVFMYMDWRSQQ